MANPDKPLTRKTGGGLACYVRNGITFSDTEFKDLNISCPDLEMQRVSVDLMHVKPIVIVNINRPPQDDYKEACSLISEAFLKTKLRNT